MSKTDKELTVEVVNTFVSSWFSKSNTSALTGAALVSLIEDVYQTISSLGETDKPQGDS